MDDEAREEGYYWIRHPRWTGAEWEPGRWIRTDYDPVGVGLWFVVGMDAPNYTPEELDEVQVGPRLEPPEEGA